MTNRNMVKPGAERQPQPNPAPPKPHPAPESDPHAITTEEPLDSPQPKPMIRRDKSGGLRKP